MSKIADKLRSKKVYNTWDIASNGNPMIGLHTEGVSAVTLSIKGRRFKNATWDQHGSLWFLYLGLEERKEAYQKALDWIAKHFPDAKMVKSPFDRYGYVPEEDLKRALEVNDEDA